MVQHLQKQSEHKGYPLTIWPQECKHNNIGMVFMLLAIHQLPVSFQLLEEKH